MGRSAQKNIHKLSALGVSRLRKAGYYGDGGGLYLQLSPAGTKSWVFRFKLHGRSREMGLGSLLSVPLKDARDGAAACRKLLAGDIDPIEARTAQRVQARLDAANSMSFAQCGKAYIDAHRAGWKNAKHASQWENTLATYAGPVFGSLPVQSVDTAGVMRVLESLWLEKPETASRLRGRIESVLDWATTRRYRTGDNPARWRGHLDNLLPARTKVRAVKHHPALPYDEMGGFTVQLREQEGIAALALEFLILTAARTGEVIGARWGEFDTKEKTWTVPAERMKGKREHRVPLPPRAAAIIDELRAVSISDFVFPGGKAGKPLSNMAMLAVLKRMQRSDLTAHGFRSSFRDWAAEIANFPREVAESALAHTIGDKVEAAYRRGDLFEKRRLMMNAWAKHCETVTAGEKVIPIRRAK